MRRIVLASLATTAALAGIGWGGLQLSNSRTYQLAGDLLTRVETHDSVIAITFDDGPSPIYTDSVMDLLAEFDAKATFFMVGSRMAEHPDVARRVVQRGHEIGNHTFDHPRMVLKRPSTIRHQVETTDSVIREAGQRGEIWFRPPYGKRLLGLPLYLRRHDRPVVLWDLEPDTYHNRASDVVAYVAERVRPGSILLLHVEFPGRSQNREALAQLLPILSSRGYEFVTLTELVRRGL